MELLYLPPEILTLIFDELTMIDLVKLACTCHNIKNIVWTDKLIQDCNNCKKMLNSIPLDPKKIKHSNYEIQIIRTFGNSDIIFEGTSSSKIYYLTIVTDGQVVFPKSIYQIQYVGNISGKRGFDYDFLISGSFYQQYRKILGRSRQMVPHFVVKNEIENITVILARMANILYTKYKNL